MNKKKEQLLKRLMSDKSKKQMEIDGKRVTMVQMDASDLSNEDIKLLKEMNGNGRIVVEAVNGNIREALEGSDLPDELKSKIGEIEGFLGHELLTENLINRIKNDPNLSDDEREELLKVMGSLKELESLIEIKNNLEKASKVFDEDSNEDDEEDDEDDDDDIVSDEASLEAYEFFSEFARNNGPKSLMDVFCKYQFALLGSMNYETDHVLFTPDDSIEFHQHIDNIAQFMLDTLLSSFRNHDKLDEVPIRHEEMLLALVRLASVTLSLNEELDVATSIIEHDVRMKQLIKRTKNNKIKKNKNKEKGKIIDLSNDFLN